MRVRVRVRPCGWGKDPLLGRPMLSLAKVGQVAIFPIAVTKVSFNLSLLHGGAQDVVCPRCSLLFRAFRPIIGCMCDTTHM